MKENASLTQQPIWYGVWRTTHGWTRGYSCVPLNDSWMRHLLLKHFPHAALVSRALLPQDPEAMRAALTRARESDDEHFYCGSGFCADLRSDEERRCDQEESARMCEPAPAHWMAL